MISKTIGITGHQKIPKRVMPFVIKGITDLINEFSANIICVSSLAVGADQLFASCVLNAGGTLHAIIPCKRYEETFTNNNELNNFNKLLSTATVVETLDFIEPSEEAFFEAGKYVVDSSEIMVAIWDGKKAKGKGGTADIVNYTRIEKKQVIILWPDGIDR